MELAAQPEGEGRQGLRPARGGPTPAGAGSGGGADLEQAITVLRARVDEEFRITERLDTKARQAFALAAAVFAVVQTVAFGSFAQGGVTPGERIALLVIAVLAGATLVVVASKVRDVEGLKPEDDFKPEAIVKWLNEAPADDSEYVSKKLVAELARVARARTDSNKTRAATYDNVEFWVRVSLIGVALELVLAVVVRI